jgi:hypothetical protein
MVLSPYHTDQISVIESLAKSAPADMVIVVKEHKPMLGKRPANFYKVISKIPRVILLWPEASSFQIINQSELVAVITGTAAFEAIRLKKPVLVIGDSPFLAIGEGVIHEPCLAKLPEAIAAGILLPPASDSALELYIAACLHESFDMNPSLLWGEYDSHPTGVKKMAANKIANGIRNLVVRDFSKAINENK